MSGVVELVVLGRDGRRGGVEVPAANRRTVWPSTPVCSKLIPAAPLSHTMIWSWDMSEQGTD